MGLEVRVLGRPAIVRDGVPQRMPGRKTWALLSLLLLGSPGATRHELAAHLAGDARDPLASLRWHLLQLRRALRPAEIVEESGRLYLRIPAGARVDVNEVLGGTLAPERAREVCGHELLEGLTFDDLSTFDMWLTLQRARVATACADVLRWSATFLVRRDPEEALTLIGIGLLRDPFNDGLHELAVQAYVALGDHGAADAHIERVSRLYRQELGCGPDPAITRVLSRAERARSP